MVSINLWVEAIYGGTEAEDESSAGLSINRVIDHSEISPPPGSLARLDKIAENVTFQWRTRYPSTY